MSLRQAARLLLLLLAVAAGGAGTLALTAPWLPPTLEADGLGFAELVGAGCAVAALACWAWWTLGTVVVAVQALSASSDRSVRWAPRAVRVLVPVLVGAAVTAVPASATTEAGPVTGTTSATAAAGTARSALAGLPLPDRVATRAPVTRTVVVRPGDTLWAVAARLLPASAATSTVDRGWRLIARANADRVADPDLIHPGTRLRVPPLTAHPREEAP